MQVPAGQSGAGRATARKQRTKTTSAAGLVHYVHLCTGEIIEVSPATAVRVTDQAVLVLNRDQVVAAYPRSAVFLVADQPMQPPSCN